MALGTPQAYARLYAESGAAIPCTDVQVQECAADAGLNRCCKDIRLCKNTEDDCVDKAEGASCTADATNVIKDTGTCMSAPVCY